MNLQERNIQFFHTNRGGDITFHGAGQVVGYPILDLEKFGTDIAKYLRQDHKLANIRLPVGGGGRQGRELHLSEIIGMTILWIVEYLALGAFAGFFAGMLGIGGGLVLVPALTLMFAAQGQIPAGETLHLAL